MKFEAMWSLNQRKYSKRDTDWFDSVQSKASVWQKYYKDSPTSR